MYSHGNDTPRDHAVRWLCAHTGEHAQKVTAEVSVNPSRGHVPSRTHRDVLTGPAGGSEEETDAASETSTRESHQDGQEQSRKAQKNTCRVTPNLHGVQTEAPPYHGPSPSLGP